MRKIHFILKDGKLFARYVIPSMLSMLTAGVYTLVDGLFVGWGAGSEGMASLNVAYPFALFLIALGSLIGVGGAVNLSIARGRGYERSAKRIFSIMVMLVIPAGILAPLFLLPNLDWLLSQMGADVTLLPASREYAQIILCFGVFQIGTVTLLEAMRNDDAPTLAMGILVAGLIINVVADYLLVIEYGFGVAGSAWATILAQGCSFLLAFWYFLSGKTTLRLRIGWRHLNRFLFRRILVSGTPSFGMQLSLGAVILLHNNQALRYGGVAGVAAYAVISYAEEIIFLLVQGIAVGVQPCVSYLHGAGKIYRRRRMAMYGIVFAVLFGACGGLFTGFGHDLVLRMFHTQEHVWPLALAGLLIAAPMYPFFAFQKVSESYFQSMERSGAASLLIYLDSCVILPMCLWILPRGWGIYGVWAAMPVSKLIMAAVALILWRSHSVSLNRGRKIGANVIAREYA